MIRGPVLPQLRASVWGQLAGRLDCVERGLTLVLEGVDCSSGQFGQVEGLARDAMGAPVLILVAVDGDGLLTARVQAACDFLERLGDSLAAAVPEACLVAGGRGRVLVVGTESGADSLARLCRLPLVGLEVCRLESFRVAGTGRLVAQWLATGASGTAGAATVGSQRHQTFEVPDRCRGGWDELRQLCERIDPGVAWDGDRFSRRLLWQGRLLGRIEAVAGELWGCDARGTRHPLRNAAETHRFVDRLLRRFAHLVGLPMLRGEDAGDTAGVVAAAGGADRGTQDRETQDWGAQDEGIGAARKATAESLRSTLTTARLSPEEYSALGGPTAVGNAHEQGADDVARIVTASPAPRPPGPGERRTD